MKPLLLFSSLSLALVTAAGAQILPAPTPVAASAPTIVPALVPYMGVALATDGKPLPGDASATFLLYKDEHGGEPLWIESQTIAIDPSGHYQVKLGATASNGLPLDTFSSGEARWLEVQIAGQSTGPRTLLTSVPYALKAADAATLGGLPASAFMRVGAPPTTPIAAPDSVAASASATVTTTGGTSGTVPVFTGGTTIGNSVLYASPTALGIGLAPSSYGVLDVGGQAIFRGGLNLARTGNASASTGTNSNPFLFSFQFYNSAAKFVYNPYFSFQAEATGNNTANPAGTMNLLYYNGIGGVPKETGLYFNPDGTIHFAPNQVFPGASGGITGVTAGTGLTGGGTTGTVQLSLDTTKVPTLSGNNSYAGSNTFVTSLYEDIDINIDNLNRNPGNISPGLRFGIASGEGMSSKRTAGGNQYGLDLYTGYQPRLSINAAGQVAIGTGATFSGPQLQVQSAAGTAVQGTSGSSYGVEGTSTSGPGVLGYTAGGTNSTGGVVGQAGGTSGFSGIAGVWGDASTHVGVYGSSSQSQGVLGVSTHASGVYGLSNDTTASDDVAGVYGIASGALPAVKGNNVGSGPAAVFINNSSAAATLTAENGSTASGVGTAILGIESQGGIGLEGETLGGVGVLGEVGISAPGNRLSGYSGNVAVWGDATTLSGIGVIGSTTDDNAGYFSNNSSASTIYAKNYGSGNTGEDVRLFGALEAATPTGTCGVGGNGDLTCTGQVKTLATTGSGARMVETYSMQSPENWMEDFGSGSLQNGRATVTIDAAFAETVSGSADYHVFLTPRGDSKGLYVTNTTASSFEVHESGGGTSTLGFDYRIVAKRRGFESQRMVDVTEAMKAVKARNDLQAARFKTAAK